MIYFLVKERPVSPKKYGKNIITLDFPGHPGALLKSSDQVKILVNKMSKLSLMITEQNFYVRVSQMNYRRRQNIVIYNLLVMDFSSQPNSSFN